MKPAPEREPDNLAGMTLSACPTACNVNRCEISGAAYCLHPAKGAPHPKTQMDPFALERWGRAKDLVAHMLLDFREAADKR